MYLIMPEEIKKLKRVFKPHMEGCHLKEDAPIEAIEAYEKYYKWYDEHQGLDQ